jgi:enoyl-[acyl-carrier protein] reductase II
MKNGFYNQIQDAYANNATTEELKILLGRGRAKKGMFEGDLEEGELEVGQVSAMISKIMPVAGIIKEITEEYESERMKIVSLKNLNT